MHQSMNTEPFSAHALVSTKAKRILVVDDLRVNFLLIKALLQKSGYETTWAEDGLIAIELIKSGHCFDAVIMDYNMPNMDGCETTKALKKITPTLVIISHSTFTDTPSFDRSSAPYDDYLPKPIKAESLRNILQKYC